MDAATTLMTDIPCRACHYNLRGLDVSGRCPECGQDIANSVAVSKLDGVPLRWFEALRHGIYFIVCVWGIYAFRQVIHGLVSMQVVPQTYLPSNISVVLTLVVCWWGMQLLAEESHPAIERNSHNKHERRLRLAVSIYTVFQLFLHCWRIFPWLEENFYWINWASPLFEAWFYWEAFSVLGKVAGLAHRPSAARHASILKFVFAALCLMEVLLFLAVTTFYYALSSR
ncbi:MAG: hypothetical protein FWD53_09135, partial [Phycisphaerales bacterium]|nr:hypothetical protein [Phycisphaerales bacterium]